MKALNVVSFFFMGLMAACVPVSIARIGPAVSAKKPGCDIEILPSGESPSRPYRDLGVVTLENCQDYEMRPCSDWLVDAACELGGQVAYLPEEGGMPRDEFVVMPMTYRVIVSAYVADLRVPIEDNPVAKSRICSPECTGDESCVDGECRQPPDCDKEEAKPKEIQAEKCME
jgi:hypothetical protein